MSDIPKHLLLPTADDRINIHETTGVPMLRTTGVSAVDLASEISSVDPNHSDVLSRHPELDLADLDAVDAYASAPIAFDVLLDRVFSPDPPDQDVLAAYLFLPRVRLSYHNHPKMGTLMHARSSFEALLNDAENCEGILLASVGFLGFLDQIGSALRLKSQTAKGLTKLEKALEQFSCLPARDCATLYALRCALVHDFSLVNIGRGSPDRSASLTHAFVLHEAGDAPLIKYPATPWGGDLDHVEETQINLGRLRELIREVRRNIFEAYKSSTLELAVPAVEARRRYIFSHRAECTDWEKQRNLDEQGRWPSSQ